jgi:hypothetical protein
MVRSVHEVARYTNIHIGYNVLISRKITISGNPLAPEVLHIATFTVFGSNRDEVKEEWRQLHSKEFHNAYCSPGTIID